VREKRQYPGFITCGEKRDKKKDRRKEMMRGGVEREGGKEGEGER
jgi:hypothetical protein